MPELDDHELIAEFAGTNSGTAFASLVARHLNLVYSTALRFTGNAHHAEEITQAVFIILARKAGKLSPRVVLSGWLYQVARFTAANFVKGEIRRQHREQEAYMQTILNEPDAMAWQQIAPLLDEAMGKLGETDRNAVVLRFFENKTAAEVAAKLKLTEAAAHKRVSRALEKLRKFFTKRGVNSTTAILAGTISANSVQAVPIGLAETISAVAIAKGAAASGSTLTLIKGALKIMAWTKAKTAAVVGAVLVLTTGTTAVIICNINKPIQSIPKDWSVLSGDVDQWNWANGKITAHSTTGDTILASAKTYRDFTISATVSTTNRDADFGFRMQDADNGYFVLFVPNGTPWSADNGNFVALMKRTDDDEITLAAYHGRGISDAGQSAKITVTAKGSWIEVRLNGIIVLRVKDTTFSSGFVGLRIYGEPNKPCDATFSNLIFH